MVYFSSFEEFETAVTQLYQERSNKTRYVTKFRQKEGKIVLKVTDDVVCLKYKTNQVQDLKKVEKLNNFFMTSMATPTE